jgi:ketosteroid isomerase-like protein
MSQENVELLRASIEAFRAGTSESDREATLTKNAELSDPDIELDASGAPVFDLSGVYRGTDAVNQFWREWLAAWETLRFEYELVDAGERVLMLFDLRMRGRSTGIEMPFGKVAWVYTFRDGLIVHQKLYLSQSEALEAVGLSEDAALLPSWQPLLLRAKRGSRLARHQLNDRDGPSSLPGLLTKGGVLRIDAVSQRPKALPLGFVFHNLGAERQTPEKDVGMFAEVVVPGGVSRPAA